MSGSFSSNARVQILLVEDDRGDFLLTRDLLDECPTSCDLEWAPDFARALELLETRRFDVCLVDFRLGAHDGLELLHSILARHRTTPVIMLTGQSDRETDLAAMEAGAVDFLVKSELTPALLERSIRYAAQRKRSESLLREREEALRQSEERYALAARGSNDGLWDWDLTRGTVYFSPRWKQLLGYADHEIDSHVGEWLGRVHLDDRVALEAALAAHCRGETAHLQSEHRLKHRDGSYRWMLARGLAVCLQPDQSDSPKSFVDDHSKRDSQIASDGFVDDGFAPDGFVDEIVIDKTSASDGFVDNDFAPDGFVDEASPRADSSITASSTKPLSTNRAPSQIANPLSFPTPNRSSDGVSFGREFVEVTAGLANLRATRIAGSMTDITERVAQTENDRFRALHDSLTGLANRALFMERLVHAFEKAERRARHHFAVLFLDLDGFKAVNDNLGHLAGDRLLIEVASRLSECLRPGDTVARFGGDEFAVVLDDMHHPSGALRAAERIQSAMTPAFHPKSKRAPEDAQSPDVHVGTSIGIAIHTRDYNRPTELLRDADIALYRAKARGKGCSQVFDETPLQIENPHA